MYMYIDILYDCFLYWISENCTSGYEYNAATMGCDECPIGFYRNQFNRAHTMCQMCDINFITATDKSDSVNDCTVSKYRCFYMGCIKQKSALKHAQSVQINITKTCLYNFDPLKPHFYIVKLGFTGVYIIFLISAHNIDCGYSLELPLRGGSNKYPQSMFWAEIWKISEFFIWKFSIFGGKFFSIYSNRHVFVMTSFYTYAKSHPDSCSPLKHFIVFNDSVYEQKIPWSDCANAQADLGICCQHMPESTFFYGMTHIFLPCLEKCNECSGSYLST